MRGDSEGGVWHWVEGACRLGVEGKMWVWGGDGAVNGVGRLASVDTLWVGDRGVLRVLGCVITHGTFYGNSPPPSLFLFLLCCIL